VAEKVEESPQFYLSQDILLAWLSSKTYKKMFIALQKSESKRIFLTIRKAVQKYVQFQSTEISSKSEFYWFKTRITQKVLNIWIIFTWIILSCKNFGKKVS
jgi:hypothetical protein